VKSGLSKLIPIRFRSTYRRQVGVKGGENPTEIREHATWWQWNGHIFRHKVHILTDGG
jgi:hypothetical protein